VRVCGMPSAVHSRKPDTHIGRGNLFTDIRNRRNIHHCYDACNVDVRETKELLIGRSRRKLRAVATYATVFQDMFETYCTMCACSRGQTLNVVDVYKAA
jgi:hypothetical protein